MKINFKNNCINICGKCNKCFENLKSNKQIESFQDYFDNYNLINRDKIYLKEYNYYPSIYDDYNHEYKWFICQCATITINEKFMCRGYDKLYKYIESEFQKKHLQLYILNSCPYYIEHYMTKCSYKKDNKQIHLELL